MILDLAPVDWPTLDWVRAERENFSLLRDCSNESEVLAEAVCEQLSRWLPVPLSDLRLLDYGAEPGSRLAALLQARIGSYLPVRLGGDADAARFHAGLTSAGSRPAFDAVLLCHVLAYVHRPDRVLSALARSATPEAVAVAVGLAPQGDQHELMLRARGHDASYPRRYDHAVHLQRWLAGHGIPRTTRTVWSQARTSTDSALRRLVEFMLGSVEAGLVEAVCAGVQREGDGAAVIRTAHSVLAWPLRYHGPGGLTGAHPAGSSGTTADRGRSRLVVP